jgi:hypothetical protein
MMEDAKTKAQEAYANYLGDSVRGRSEMDSSYSTLKYLLGIPAL